MKKVNASICAPPTTDHDPAGVIPDRKRNFVIFDFSCGPMVVGINTCRNIFCIFIYGLNLGISLVIMFAKMVCSFALKNEPK